MMTGIPSACQPSGSHRKKTSDLDVEGTAYISEPEDCEFHEEADDDEEEPPRSCHMLVTPLFGAS
jgi:hypothetical protein